MSPERRGLQAAGSSKCSSPSPAAVPAPPTTSPLETPCPHSPLTSMVCAWRAASRSGLASEQPQVTQRGRPWVSWASSHSGARGSVGSFQTPFFLGPRLASR